MKGKLERLGGKLFLLTGLQIVLVMSWLPATAFCSSVMLDWDPSSDPEVSGYRVYYQADSQAQPFSGSGAAEGSAPIEASTATSATINGLDPASSYYFAVTAYNSQGVESAYSNVVQVQEMVAPSVSITSPAANSALSGSVAVAASAGDNRGVSRVEFYLNGALMGSDGSAPYGYNWDTSALGNGQYTLSAKAYDAAGNVGVSEIVVSVAGDSSAPAVAVTAPANNATVSGLVTVTAAASDNVGIARVELYDNGTLLFAGNQTSLSYSWDTARVANGAHVITARAFDGAGNLGSASVSVSVLNDTTAPVATITAPTGTAVGNSYVRISALATDNVAVSRMELYVDGKFKAGTNSASISYSTRFPGGSHQIEVRAYDAAGNLGRATKTVTR